LPHLAEEDAMRYSSLREQGREEIVLDALGAIDSSIKRLEVLSPLGSSMLYAELSSGRRIPLPLLGDGAVRLVRTLLTMSLATQGILLIDEVGYGLHYSVLSEVWTTISKAAQVFNTQVIATTHSFEIIRAAHLSFSDKGEYDRFGYIRLEKTGEKTEAIRMDREPLQLAVDRGFEVR
jgi:predicted ATP-binding protein involved in virulence